MPRPLVLYVATTGSAAGDGSERRPFATLVAARDALRRLRRGKAPTQAVEVRVAAGVYRLDEPLVFTPADGGTARCPVTWTGMGGRPLISGGRALTNWSAATINGVDCWQTRIPEVQAGTWWFTQLFVNGRRRLRARWPKMGFLHFAGVPADEVKRDPGGFFHAAMSAYYAAGDLPEISNLDDIDVVVPDHWYENHLRLAGIETSTRTLRFATKGYSRFSRDETGRGTRYRFDHVREACTGPGDWYLERATGTLSYIPMPGETLADALIEAPRLERLLDVAGDALDATKHVCHLRFQFLDLRHAEWELPRDNAGTLQSDFQVPGAVRFVGAEDCALYACRVSQVAGWAVEVLRGCERTRVVGCALHDLGAGGVKIGHEGGLPTGWRENAFRGLDHLAMGWGPDREVAGGALPGRDACPSSATTVSDCSIHHGGLIFHSAIGVWIGDASRNRVVHNHIHHFFYSGISCGWTWGFAPAHAHDNRIEANRIHDIGQGVLSDMGAIYTLGRQAGTTINRNVISEVRSYGYGGWGIYPDEGSSWMTVAENVVSGTKCGGFHQHYGRDNLITNNLFVDASENQIQVSRNDFVRSVIFTGNLVHGAGNGNLVQGDGWASAQFDRNVYCGDPGQRAMFVGASDWTAWQKQGCDPHGAFTDVQMLDASALGVAAADQKTLRLTGIKPATVVQVLAEAGPRLRTTLPASIDRVPPEVEVRRPIVEALLWPWAAEWPDASDTSHLWSKLSQDVSLRSGTTLTLSLTVNNRGDAPVSGSYRLKVIPASAARLVGASRLAVRLKPGERTSLQTTVRATGRASRFHIEAVPTGAHLPSQRIRCACVKAMSMTVPRLTGVGFAVLDAVADQPINGMGSALAATMRLAIAGEALLLRVRTKDVSPNQGKMPWDGSSCELFLAPTLGVPAVQLTFVPAVTGHAAKAQMVSAGALIDRPEIDLSSHLDDQGWTLEARIPLSVAGLSSGVEAFVAELVVTATPSKGTAMIKAQIASDVPAHKDSNNHVQMRVVG